MPVSIIRPTFPHNPWVANTSSRLGGQAPSSSGAAQLEWRFGLWYSTAGRGVAQPGSALAWGARGRRFESDHPDHWNRDTSWGPLAPCQRRVPRFVCPGRRRDSAHKQATEQDVPLRQDSGRAGNPAARWSTVGLVALAVFFTALDQTVVVTVLPDVMVDLRIPVSKLDQASWIITGYLLGYTVVIPLAARLADAHGHAILFRLSLVVFGVASVAVALSPDLPWLVGSRVVQAAGGGATIPIGLAIATNAMPSHRRAIAVGVVGAAAEMGVVLGPLYGGIITEAWGWRWLFWLDVPQALLILVALHKLPRRSSSGYRVDYAGGLLLAVALTLMVVALSRRDLFDGSSLAPYALGAAAVAVLAALVWLERRMEQPLLSPAFFRSRAVLATLSAKLLMGAALIISMVTVPLMANTVLERSSLEGGLMLMRLTVTVPVGALLGGYLAYRFGHRVVSALGLAVAAAGLFLMSGWNPDDGDAMLTIHLLQAGLGFGLVIAPLFVAAMDAGPDDYQATAASLVTVARMVGMALGLAALSAWGMDRFLLLAADLPPALSSDYGELLAEASITLFQDFFRVSAWLCVAALVPVAVMGGVGRRGARG